MPHDLFKNLLHREHLNLMEVLAGADASTGVPMVAQSTIEVHAVLHCIRMFGNLHGVAYSCVSPVYFGSVKKINFCFCVPLHSMLWNH